MANPKFVLGANELQFSRGLKYPVSKPHEKIQVTDRTAGGTLQVEDLGIDIHTRHLMFKNLPLADYTALRTWYDSICEGAKNTFTYYDEGANTYTVRMLTNPVDFPQTFYQKYSGELLLEVIS